MMMVTLVTLVKKVLMVLLVKVVVMVTVRLSLTSWITLTMRIEAETRKSRTISKI